MTAGINLSGITSSIIPTTRLSMHVLHSGSIAAQPLLLVHGNLSGASFFQELMLAMSAGYYCVAPDLRGYGETEDLPIDATRGAGDWADDLTALLNSLKIESTHLLGWSAGAAAITQFAIDNPDRVLSMILVAPVSPFGFGGTKDINGTPCYPDYAGSGSGMVNGKLVRSIKDKHYVNTDQSLYNILHNFYVQPSVRLVREEQLVQVMMSQKLGDKRYPGDFVVSQYWPNFAPGHWGPINALSPQYYNTSHIADLERKPPIFWIRGEFDQVISDSSPFDFGTQGKLGLRPDWPGLNYFPPQPMVSQMKAVLNKYRNRGGNVTELMIPDTGHTPFLEKQDVFVRNLMRFLKDTR